MKRLLSGLFMCLSLAVHASDASVESAYRAFKAGNYPVAYKQASALAEKGEPNAEALLGTMYRGGLGVRQDLEAAQRFYTKAAAQGHAAAMHNLASMYYRGLGVNKNYAKALSYNRKAAQIGLIIAQYDYALMLESGVGTSIHTEQAIKWYQLAADSGYPNASYRLGRLLWSGRWQKRAEATHYLCKAASLGVDEAARFLGPNISACHD